MADNTTLDVGTGGDVIATDDIGGVKYQRVKISQGADGSATDVGIGGGTEATALRVTVASDSTGVLSVDDNGSTLSIDDGAGSITVDGTVAVSGTVTVDLSTNNDVTVTSGAITETNSGAALTSLQLIDDAVYTDGTGTPSKAIGVAGTDGTNPQILSTNATGHVNIADGGNSITVDNGGTFAAQAAQSGTWTVQPGNTANTTAWKVDGSAVTQPVSGTVTANLGATDNAVLDDIAAQALAIKTAVQGTLTVTGGGGGTEYTVNAIAPTDPVGTASLMERDDALSALTEIEGDWTNMRANANGALWVKNDGTVTVDGSGVTQPVSGTVTANAGTGTLAVSNTVISVVGSGTEAAAQRVTIATDSTGVLSVDDNGGSLTVDNGGTFVVQDSQVVADNAGFTDGTTKVFVTGFIYDEVAGTALTENDAAAARINVNRAQVGILEDGATRGRYATVSAANALKVDGSAVTQPVSGTVTATPSGAAAVVGTGTEATAQRVTIATDSTGVLSVDDNGASLTVDYATTGSGTATGALRVELPTNGTGVVGLNAGTNAIGKLAANSGVDIGDVDILSIAAGTNSIGNVGIVPRTTGGYTIFQSIDLDESEEEVKATAGQLYGWYIFNAAATTHYVKFYNLTAANTTVGTSTPILTLPVPAGSAANASFPAGIAFSTALSAAATTGVAVADTGAPAANAVVVNLFYA